MFSFQKGKEYCVDLSKRKIAYILVHFRYNVVVKWE